MPVHADGSTIHVPATHPATYGINILTARPRVCGGERVEHGLAQVGAGAADERAGVDCGGVRGGGMAGGKEVTRTGRRRGRTTERAGSEHGLPAVVCATDAETTLAGNSTGSELGQGQVHALPVSTRPRAHQHSIRSVVHITVAAECATPSNAAECGRVDDVA